MANNTTFTTIRQAYCGTGTALGVLQALTPSICSEKKFIRSRHNKPLREWATGTTSAAFRAFELTRSGPAVEPNVLDPGSILRIEQVTLTVAYPVLPALFGTDQYSIEDVIRSDAHQLRDALMSPGNYVTGMLSLIPAIQSPERGEDIWFQDIICDITYYESQTLT